MGKVVSLFWLPSHVGIRGNEKADAAARAALSLPVTHFQIPHTDLKSKIDAHFIKVWQVRWNSVVFNKLKLIKPNLGFTKLAGLHRQKDESTLHRIRIGHTYLMHSFLLKQEAAQQCMACACYFTMDHILLHCSAFAPSRSKYVSVGSLFELFNIVSASNIVNFLKEIQLYGQI